MTSVGQAKSPARLERRSGGRPKSPPAGRAGITARFRVGSLIKPCPTVTSAIEP